MTDQRISPVLSPMCTAIDNLFVKAIGPFGTFLAEQGREEWLKQSKRIRPADVESYIQLLAKHVSNSNRKATFINDARGCITL
jgi:hypothetical protein